MAFFKFRFTGDHAADEAVASAANQNLEVVRRRARHRLIGAVVLVLIAVVGFPLVFDTQPRPVAVDTPIVIPDRQAVMPLTSPAAVPAAQAPANPLKTTPQELSTRAALDPSEEVVTAPASAHPNAVVNEANFKPEAPIEKPKEKQTEKAKEKVLEIHSKDDGGKAKALLEGKAASSERLIIQVGAFTDVNKVRDVRRKLEDAGLKTYTQIVDGKDGKPTTRVRLGPYDSRDEVEKVLARIRKLNLSPAVLKI
ncbi:SPOR domain-containing protein [Limnohabitans sp. Jir72]|uniref:SPOR domain-containing protein n=1 Tax=Limnohabitans sp. Jir72 TaxID=1977909 RepID=UPI000D35A6B9|nr:SPOR domain-containing protein [Limnohabitans sp. Jir72]PUE31881.1 SPOR domain-containing protein [Limnohabitans sp. Jir72]